MALEAVDPTPVTSIPESNTPTGGLGTYSASVPYKIVQGGKNQLSTITPTSGMLLSPEASGSIKNNMAELLKKYQNPYDEFQSALDDMVARVQYRPAEALRQRAEERQQREANIYNLKMNMANMEASQASAQNMAKALGLGGGAPTGGAGGVPLAPGVSAQPGGQQGMAPTWVDMLKSLPVEQQPIGMAYLQGGDVGNFNKLVAENSMKRPDTQKLYEWSKTQSPQVQDMVRGQLFEKGLAPRTYIDEKTGKTIQYSGIGAIPPTAAPTTVPPPSTQPSVGAPITNYGNIRPQGQSTGFQTYSTPEEGLAAIDKNLQSYGQKGINTLEGIITRWSPPNENDTPALIANASKRLGLNPKQPLDMSNPGIRQAIGTAIMLQEHGNKIFAAPATATAAPTAVAPTAPVARGPIAKEDVEQTQKNIDVANKAFNEEFYKPLAAKAAIADEQILESNRALEALKGVEHGPGESIKLAAIKAKMMAGLPVSKDEEARYLSDMTLENVKQSKVARGAKAAMGSQYTGKESDNFAKTLAGINDKNEYIKTIYQIDIAKAKVDKAHEEFLRNRREDMSLAQNEWDKSGIREKIFKDTVDAFNKSTKKETTTSTKQIDPDAEARQWLAQNPDHPKAATVKKLLGIK